MPSNPENPSANGDADKPVSEPIQHHPISARVPERITRGVYSSGQLVLDSPKEFVIDFLQNLTRPFLINARVVMAPSTMVEFANTLQSNIEHYTRAFGPPPVLPPQQNRPRPSIQEIYDNHKLADELLCGAYANQVLIGHSPTDFFFDFITGFYPTPAVSARVYVPAAVVPRFLSTLRAGIEQYQKRFGSGPLSAPRANPQNGMDDRSNPNDSSAGYDADKPSG